MWLEGSVHYRPTLHTQKTLVLGCRSRFDDPIGDVGGLYDHAEGSA